MRTCLDRLEAGGIIAAGDPDIVAARMKRPHRRPQNWGLNLSLVGEDLDDAAVTVLRAPGNRDVQGRVVTRHRHGSR